VEFCKRLGGDFRLPTEAEWEYASRAGSQTRFWYGDDPNYSELDQYAWYYGKSDNKTHRVGQKKPNTWDLYDMYGNVSEWCSDRYIFGSNYENVGEVGPTDSNSVKDLLHVYRGGNWLEIPRRCRSANREGFMQNVGIDLLGFRVVYTGRADGDNEVLEIALPESTSVVATTSDKESEGRLQAIAGVVRDEAGLPIDDVEMNMLPIQDWLLRLYAKGRFEAYKLPQNSDSEERYLLVRHIERNLVSDVEIDENANTLDFKLKPGIILSGKVVDPDGKQIAGAKVTTMLQGSGWRAIMSPLVVETDAEGGFEFRALPLGYDYNLSARKIHYRIGETEVRSESFHDNHIDGISIVLPRGKFSVSGIVVDANDKPVPKVWVFCTGNGQAGINSETNEYGRFKADGIFEGKVDIIASTRGSYGKTLGGSITVEAGATNVKIVLNNKRIATPKGRTCFPAGTDVWINGEIVPISTVVQAVPTLPFGHIEKVEEHEGTFECRDILLENGNRISVVDSHCFMLDSGRWIPAQDLRNGHRLKTFNGAVTIKSVRIRETLYIGKVYNLKIKNSDRYMVGKDGVIVRDY